MLINYTGSRHHALTTHYSMRDRLSGAAVRPTLSDRLVLWAPPLSASAILRGRSRSKNKTPVTRESKPRKHPLDNLAALRTIPRARSSRARIPGRNHRRRAFIRLFLEWVCGLVLFAASSRFTRQYLFCTRARGIRLVCLLRVRALGPMAHVRYPRVHVGRELRRHYQFPCHF